MGTLGHIVLMLALAAGVGLDALWAYRQNLLPDPSRRKVYIEWRMALKLSVVAACIFFWVVGILAREISVVNLAWIGGVGLLAWWWVLAPQAMYKPLQTIGVRRHLNQLPLPLQQRKPTRHEFALLRRQWQAQPKAFNYTLRLLQRWHNDRQALREDFPSLNRAFLTPLVGYYLPVLCAGCLHLTRLKKLKCARCGSNELFLDVLHTGITYSPKGNQHYVADRAQGRFALNLAHPRAWQYGHVQPTFVDFDFGQMPDPDHLLSRALTTFPRLHDHPDQVRWSIARPEALAPNGQRLLADLLRRSRPQNH